MLNILTMVADMRAIKRQILKIYLIIRINYLFSRIQQ